ncbi:MAG: carbamoyltransferase, partial [Planctomycetes bacterium]|nr:carbamoyltransferase [Planctomycetota bacterium]
EMDEVEDIFIGPSGGDESLSIGAAYALWCELNPGRPPVRLAHTYLGPAYDQEAVSRAITDLPPGIRVMKDPDDEYVAGLLAAGKVIAISRGRMEYGARALGNRSILARADDPGTIRLINDQIKLRDFWMPFAPMILEERIHDYAVNPKNIRSPYMTMGFDSTDLAKKHLRAALHPADDSMRPQIVEKAQNPRLYTLLKHFEAKTGFGGLLNTSFNKHGEPVCCTPQDSIRTFLGSDLDGLLMEGYLLLRERGEVEGTA